jgi:hypothetical protein
MKTLTVDLVMSDEEFQALSTIYVPVGSEDRGLRIDMVANLAPTARVCSPAYPRKENDQQTAITATLRLAGNGTA